MCVTSFSVCSTWTIPISNCYNIEYPKRSYIDGIIWVNKSCIYSHINLILEIFRNVPSQSNQGKVINSLWKAIIVRLHLLISVGSVLIVKGGRNDDNGCFIQLNEDSTLTGFFVNYPNQQKYQTPVQYPWYIAAVFYYSFIAEAHETLSIVSYGLLVIFKHSHYGYVLFAHSLCVFI